MQAGILDHPFSPKLLFLASKAQLDQVLEKLRSISARNDVNYTTSKEINTMPSPLGSSGADRIEEYLNNLKVSVSIRMPK
jgi:hypothetical protein